MDGRSRTKNIRNQTVVAGSERRIFYFHRKMCGEDTRQGDYPCASIILSENEGQQKQMKKLSGQQK